jgi:hypothetical protein
VEKIRTGLIRYFRIKRLFREILSDCFLFIPPFSRHLPGESGRRPDEGDKKSPVRTGLFLFTDERVE